MKQIKLPKCANSRHDDIGTGKLYNAGNMIHTYIFHILMISTRALSKRLCPTGVPP